jgi:hypothetical protein
MEKTREVRERVQWWKRDIITLVNGLHKHLEQVGSAA